MPARANLPVTVLLKEGTEDDVFQRGTGGAAHVSVQGTPNVAVTSTPSAVVAGTGINVAASISVNTAVAANVDAAVASNSGRRLVGFACRESAVTPAAATFSIVHGATGAGGTIVVPIKLVANEFRAVWFGDAGIAVANGLSILWVAGTVDVELFFKTVA